MCSHTACSNEEEVRSKPISCNYHFSILFSLGSELLPSQVGGVALPVLGVLHLAVEVEAVALAGQSVGDVQGSPLQTLPVVNRRAGLDEWGVGTHLQVGRVAHQTVLTHLLVVTTWW